MCCRLGKPGAFGIQVIGCKGGVKFAATFMVADVDVSKKDRVIILDVVWVRQGMVIGVLRNGTFEVGLACFRASHYEDGSLVQSCCEDVYPISCVTGRIIGN